VLGDIRSDAHIVDALIGLSVVYKGFENLGGFERVFGVRPNPKIAATVFGLIHGFGLATKLQDFQLPQNGLVINMVSFNVGVEIGQVLALAVMLTAFTYWRKHASFNASAFAANALLMASGFVLMDIRLADTPRRASRRSFGWQTIRHCRFVHTRIDSWPMTDASRPRLAASSNTSTGWTRARRCSIPGRRLRRSSSTFTPNHRIPGRPTPSASTSEKPTAAWARMWRRSTASMAGIGRTPPANPSQ
jgi:hypothetical protein